MGAARAGVRLTAERALPWSLARASALALYYECGGRGRSLLRARARACHSCAAPVGGMNEAKVNPTTSVFVR